MKYLVSLQEVDVPWGFTSVFSENERNALLNAEPNQLIYLNDGTARLDQSNHMNLTLKSLGGTKNHAVLFDELCKQLLNPDNVELFNSKIK